MNPSQFLVPASAALALIVASPLVPFSLNAQDLTPQVLSLLQKRCQECHHPDTADDFPYLHEGTKIEDLIEEEILTAGKPEESSLLKRVSLEPDASKRMPKSRGAKGDETYRDPLSNEEKELIKNWIVQLGNSGGTTPGATKPLTVTETKPAPVPTPGNAPAAGTIPATATTPTPGAAPASVPATAPVPKSEELKASVSDDENRMPSGLSQADKVHWIFENRCSQCHAGDYEPELHGTVNLTAFFSEKDASGTSNMAQAVVERVSRAHDAEGRMPKSKGAPNDRGFRPPLNEEEREVLNKWVDAGSPETKERDFITNEEVLDSIYDDLRGASEAEQRFYRYFTLTNLYNQADENGAPMIADLDTHRAAVGKLMNSLSMNGRITFPFAIDEEKTIYRVDLRDYNWDKEDWEKVVHFYPYGIIGVDRQKEQLIERFTGSKMAYLRADWFTFAAAQPPLYDKIMDKLLGIEVSGKDDDVLAKLDHALGVDRMHNLQEGNAMRAGFQFSGVSGANRLIERHELGSHQGAYWVSYDFTPLSAKRTQDLKLAPLGPTNAHLSADPDRVFQHDGGEMIYNLPNGLQGYMLTTNTGKRLDRAPIEIVQDDNRQDKVILNGISCMACHAQGMKPAIRVTDLSKRTLETMTDEIRPLVEAANILDFSEKKLLEKLYPEPAVFQAAIKEDFERFVRAETEATGGISVATEPVWGLYSEFRSPVTARKLAAEFGSEFDEMLRLLDEESDRSEVLSVISSSLSRGIPIRRENLLREYIAMVYALGYELMPFTPLGYEDFGGEKYAQLIAGSDQFLAAFGQEGLKVSDVKEAVIGSTGSDNLAHESVLLHGGGKLRISIQPKLTVGERAKLDIVATDDVHVRVYHLSSDKHVTELYPGSTGQATFRPKNKKLQVSWETTSPGGPEHVIVFASAGEIKNIATGEKVGDFTVYDKAAIFSTRGIPKAIRAGEVDETSSVPAQIVQARIGYILKEKQ